VDLKHTQAEPAGAAATGVAAAPASNKSAAKELAALVAGKGKEGNSDADAAATATDKTDAGDEAEKAAAAAEKKAASEAAAEKKAASEAAAQKKAASEAAAAAAPAPLVVQTAALTVSAGPESMPPTPDTARAEDDWDAQDPADMKVVKTPSAAKPSMPSFRPGGNSGGIGAMVAGPAGSQSKNSKTVYTRADLMELRSLPELKVRPEKLPALKISIDPNWIADAAPPASSAWGSAAKPGSVRSGQSYATQAPSSFGRSNSAGGGGYNQPRSSGGYSQPSNRGSGGGGGGNQWSRGKKAPERQQQQGGGGRKGKGRGRGRGDNYVSPPVGNYAPKKSTNAWTLEGNKTEDDDVDTIRKCTVLLNKLAPERFERIAKNMVAIEIKNRTVFRTLIYSICDMALGQPVYASMYAELCAKVAKKAETFAKRMVHVEQRDSPEGKAWFFDVGDDQAISKAYRSEKEAQAAGEKKASFKRILLSKCQEEFEKTIDWNAFEKEVDWTSLNVQETKQARAEVNYKVGLAKKRMLGNIKFIGELFMKHMLKAKIMHHCVAKLLSNVETPEVEHIESVCKLLTVIGKELDKGKYKTFVDAYFQRITHMQKQKTLATRIRFMLADVIELRKRKWKPRRDEKAPSTIAQVRQQAAQEELKKSQANQRGRDDRRGGGGGGGHHNNRGGGGHHNNSRGNDRRGNNNKQSGGFMPKVYTSRPAKGSAPAKAPASIKSSSSASRSAGYSISLKPGGSSTSFRPGGGGGLKLGPGGRGQQQQQQQRPRNAPAGRKGNVSRYAPAPAPAPAPKKAAPWPLEKFHKKCTSTIKEFMNILDEKEVAECLKEYAQEDNSPFVHMVMKSVVNSKHAQAKARTAVAKLFGSLCGSMKTLTAADMEKGFKLFASTFDDMCIDLPRAPQYVADLFALLVADGVCKLGTLMSCFDKTCVGSGRPEKVLSKTLGALKKAKGVAEASKILGADAAACKAVLRRDTLNKFLADSYDNIKDLASDQTA